MLPTFDPDVSYLPLNKLKDVRASIESGKFTKGAVVVLDESFQPSLVLVPYEAYQQHQEEFRRLKASVTVDNEGG